MNPSNERKKEIKEERKWSEKEIINPLIEEQKERLKKWGLLTEKDN